MNPRPDTWLLRAGVLASYVGAGKSVRHARQVRIKAEARKGRYVVEAIGRQGIPVLITVKRESLSPPQPDLFD